jgi:peptide/nickel transport system permease protein
MRKLLKCGVRTTIIVLLSAVLSAFLVRFSPGAMVDERELNQKLGNTALADLRAHQADRQNIGRNFVSYLAGLPKGDLGYSESNNAPILALIQDRAPATLTEITVGLAFAWVFGFVFSIPGLRKRGSLVYDAASATCAGLLMSIPVALFAYFSVAAALPAGLVMGAVLAPRIFRFSRSFLRQAYSALHIEAARANGVSELRIFTGHVLPSVGPQFLALAAISITMAIGAAIPIETICDAPGLGRLAWQSALARDLPLLVNLTMLIAISTTAAMTVAEAFTHENRS